MVRLARTIAMVAVSVSVAAASNFSFRGSAQVSEDYVKETFTGELADSQHRVPEYEEAMRQMYATLPKNEAGLLTHQMVRYALHRFFLNRHGWFVRGLEPKNASYVPPPGRKLFVKEWVPDYLQTQLEQAEVGGTDLHGIAVLAATLEDLIRHELSQRMGLVYQLHHQPMNNVTQKEAEDLLYTYMITFALGNNFTLIDETKLTKKRQNFAKKYRGYDRTMKWFVKTMTGYFGRKVKQGDVTPEQVDFATTAEAVYELAGSYHEYNDNECEDLRATLKGLEGRRAGRVRLSTFYNMSFSSHWKFVESADYLRVTGALDESDPKAPSVIISNYLLSRANCLDASNLFSVCCRNTCDDLLTHLEQELGSHSATPALIADLVSKLSSKFVEAPRVLPDLLLTRLEDIARNHGGEVPLHGRLFSQWMHHAYPLECPFPHELGNVNPETYEEWLQDDNSMVASKEEMREQVEGDLCAVNWEGRIECQEELTDLPWSMTEDRISTSRIEPEPAEVRVLRSVDLSEASGVQFMTAPRRRGATSNHALLLAAIAAPVLSVISLARRFGVGAQLQAQAGKDTNLV